MRMKLICDVLLQLFLKKENSPFNRIESARNPTFFSSFTSNPNKMGKNFIEEEILDFPI